MDEIEKQKQRVARAVSAWKKYQKQEKLTEIANSPEWYLLSIETNKRLIKKYGVKLPKSDIIKE